jgi:hypothetical protein
MARGPKAVALELADAERAALTTLIRRRTVSQALAQRARVVLACAAPGATNLGVARPWVSAGRPWPLGAGASPRTGWRGWSMRPVPARRAGSGTRRSSA